jgi:hypothetical protein
VAAASLEGAQEIGHRLRAQLTQGWGTRQTIHGKTIWCAQTLTEPEPR